MLHVLRPTRANHWTLPRAHRRVACTFTLLLVLPVSLLKKSFILIPSTSSFPVAASRGCPVQDAYAHFPRCCRAPYPPPLARTPLRAPLAPSRRALVLVVLAPPVPRVACPVGSSVLVMLARAAGAGC
jgi:hypothetical protein